MTPRALLSLGDDDVLRLEIEHRPSVLRRDYTDHDVQTLQGIIQTYRNAVGRSANAVQTASGYLEQAGRALYEWLDGGQGWGDEVRQAGQGGLSFEVRVPDVEAAPRSTFLDAPWETLHDERGFWAKAPELGFGPYRRIGAPHGDPVVPTGGLQALFMAAAPTDVPQLQFEAEEQAILSATAGLPVTLTVEETGSAAGLELRAARLVPPPAVVHLSCHGASRPRPCLALEDAFGRKKSCDVDALRAALQATATEGSELGLLFLSACLTARGVPGEDAELVESLCTGLIRRGQRAVLGWAGSVRDLEAIRFAAELYKRLAQGSRLSEAVTVARRALLFPEQGTPESRDWHLARLYLGRRGGGALTARGARPPLRPQVTKAFLDARKEVAVASPERFVGRRRPLQAALHVLEGQDHGGLLIHGVGRQGKSSLAARLADRLQGSHQLAVVFGPKARHYTARVVVERIADAYLENPDVQAWKQQHLDSVDSVPESLETALSALLTGPLSGQQASVKPLLLVVDDFERALESPAAGNASPTRVVTEPRAVRPTVRALLKAFRSDKTHSRVVFTSRLRFVFDDRGQDLATALYALSLPGMSTGEAQKQVRARGAGAAKLRTDQTRRFTRAALGNPGLLDVLLGLAELDDDYQAAERALLDMEALAKGKGGDIQSPELRTTLESIAVGALLNALTASEQLRVKVSSVFEDCPVPAAALEALGRTLGFDGEHRLIALGVWEQHRDPTNPERPAIALNTLVRAHLVHQQDLVLSEVDRHVIVRAGVEVLCRHWNPQTLMGTAAWQLARLALEAGEAETLCLCVKEGFDWWHPQVSFRKSGQFAIDCMTLFESVRAEPPVLFVIRAAEQAKRMGEPRRAAAWFARLRERYPHRIDDALKRHQEELQVYEQLGDVRERAITLGDIARIYTAQGQVDDALRLHQERLQAVEQLRDVQARAVTLGDIARIYTDQGRVDDALKLHHEELKLYEQLEDVQARAVTLGDIARIYTAQGRVDDALKLHQEELKLYEQLEDVRSRAVTLGDIARIYTAQGRVDDALKLHQEKLQAVEQLGALRERAVTLGGIARIYRAQGRVDDALKLHQEMLEAFEQLGAVRDRAITLGDIADIYTAQGRVDDALKLHQEMLEAFEQLGAVRDRGVTLGEIARIYTAQGRVDDALKLHQEELKLYEQLGAVRDRAVTLGDIADIQRMKGNVDEAYRLHTERLQVNERLDDKDGIAAASWRLSKILAEDRNTPSEALPYVRRAYELFISIGRVAGIIVVGIDHARILHVLGDREAAINIARQIRTVAERVGDDGFLRMTAMLLEELDAAP